MQKHFPTGKAQDMVLQALGLTAEHRDHANAIFDAIGITVSHERVGRTVEPMIMLRDSVGGTFNAWGEGDTWDIPTQAVDLTPVMHWIVEQDREAAERMSAKAQAANVAHAEQDEQTDDGVATDAQVTQLTSHAPRSHAAPLAMTGYQDGTELVTFRRSGSWYAVLQGSHEGNWFESEDIGPFETRADAEEAGRDAYAEDQRPVMD